jgi:hypothetical protein
MKQNLQNFLGGSPGTVLVKLIFLSLLAGAFMSVIGLTPVELIMHVVDWMRGVFNLGFEALEDLVRWLVYGAVVVVPIWLLLRLTRMKG